MSFIFKNTFVLCCILLLSQISVFSQTIVYVNAAAKGNNDGSSWANAFTYLPDAVAAAPAQSEIWIAQIATEGYTVTNSNIITDRILISKQVSLIGGFVGNEVSKSQVIPGQYSIISGEIGDTTILTDNSNTAIQIKNTHVILQGILFRKFYSIDSTSYPETNPNVNGVIIADTNAVVDIKDCSFMQNIGTTNGACISSFMGSVLNMSESNFVNNIQPNYASLITRNDDAIINVSNTIFTNNGNTTSGGYVFYALNASAINNTLQTKTLINISNSSFETNNMAINYAYYGSSSFKNCTFDLNATVSGNVFNQFGDSSSFYMDSCTFNGSYNSTLIYAVVKNFKLSHTTILNPISSSSQFFYLYVHDTVSISSSAISNIGGSQPIYIYAPNGSVFLNDFLISDSDVSSYMLYIVTNTLNCNKLQLKNSKAGFGNYYYCNQASFKACVIDGFQGYDVLNCNSIPVVTFDSCTINGVQQSETLFRSYSNSSIFVTNSTISNFNMTINDPGQASLFSNWNGQSLYIANNTFDNIYSYGNIIDNDGDIFIANCSFTNLLIQNSQNIFHNGQKLWVYNSNINANYTIPFFNDTLLVGSAGIDFRLINSIVYTQQDTIIKSSVNPVGLVSVVSNNISNQNIYGPNSISGCTIPYDNLYDDAYSIIYNKGLTPVGISQFPLVDLFGNPRVVDGIIDIGVKEYQSQITTGVLTTQAKMPINVYPNPTHGVFHINSMGIGSVNIFDCGGRVVFNGKLYVGENAFDISQLSAGIYFVSSSINEDNFVNKLILVK